MLHACTPACTGCGCSCSCPFRNPCRKRTTYGCARNETALLVWVQHLSGVLSRQAHCCKICGKMTCLATTMRLQLLQKGLGHRRRPLCRNDPTFVTVLSAARNNHVNHMCADMCYTPDPSVYQGVCCKSAPDRGKSLCKAPFTVCAANGEYCRCPGTQQACGKQCYNPKTNCCSSDDCNNSNQVCRKPAGKDVGRCAACAAGTQPCPKRNSCVAGNMSNAVWVRTCQM